MNETSLPHGPPASTLFYQLDKNGDRTFFSIRKDKAYVHNVDFRSKIDVSRSLWYTTEDSKRVFVTHMWNWYTA